MLEGVFSLNFELFGVSNSLGEMTRVFSVRSVKLIFHELVHIDFIDPRVKVGKEDCHTPALLVYIVHLSSEQ